ENVVVIDSDTYPIRPAAFATAAGQQILYNGDANQAPFHCFTERALGALPANPRNYIAHCMLFRRSVLAALHSRIETANGRPWAERLLALSAEPTNGMMSEFDLYGQFMRCFKPDESVERYYANIKVTPDEFDGTAPLPRWKRRFRFVSNHQRA
ncbi:MAG: hypothetical protein AAF334_11865, partial [Pseudomonadota bacterium]